MKRTNSNNVKRIAAAVMVMGAAASGMALAQSGRYDGPYNAAYNSSWYVMPSVDGIDPDNRFGTNHRGEGVGIRLGKVVSPSWDIQFGPTFSRVKDGDGRYKQNTFGVDAVYLFSRERFRPLLLIGGGAENDRVSGPFGSVKHTSPFVNAGLGFQYSFSEQWGMQADLRREYAHLRGNDFGFNRANTNVLTVGLTYAFSKRVAPAPRASIPAPEPVQPLAAAAPTPPAPAATLPAPAPRMERYTLSAIDLFDFDSSTLRLPQPKLDEIVDALGRNAQVGHVGISGYTDRLGSDKYNLALSQRRADSVKRYLVGKSIDAGRLTAVGKGESNPVVECHDKKRSDLITCLKPNRRVEVEQIAFERRVQ